MRSMERAYSRVLPEKHMRITRYFVERTHVPGDAAASSTATAETGAAGAAAALRRGVRRKHALSAPDTPLEAARLSRISEYLLHGASAIPQCIMS